MSKLADVHPGDSFARSIESIIRRFDPKTILEIGSSDGTGSTSIIAKQIISTGAKLFCIEMDKDRFAQLVKNTIQYGFIKRYYCSSVGADRLMTLERLNEFRRDFPHYDVWKSIGWDEVIKWHNNSLIEMNTIEINEGIKHIKTENNITHFDLAIIDGGAFTGMAELKEVYGSKVIFLDDIIDIKCYDAYQYMLSDMNYTLFDSDLRYRNGYAVFIQNSNSRLN